MISKENRCGIDHQGAAGVYPAAAADTVPITISIENDRSFILEGLEGKLFEMFPFVVRRKQNVVWSASVKRSTALDRKCHYGILLHPPSAIIMLDWIQCCDGIGVTPVDSICVERFRDKGSSSVGELCKELMPDNYKVYEAPSNNGTPLNVFIGFQVLDVGEINEEKMDFHLHLFIMYAWNDTRLILEKYTTLGRPAILYSECTNHIWTPDVFFETAKRIETFRKTSPTTILNIFPDRSIVVSVRYSFKADCSMNFDSYPFDSQICEFLVAHMYSHDGVAVLKWIDDKESSIDSPPIEMMRDVDLLQFYLLEPTWSSFTKDQSGVNHTHLVAKFTIVRRLTGTIISTFAPSVLIVIMSWVSFWLRMDAIPARVALSITSLLTLCTQADQSKKHLPPISYMTALDIWLFMCIIMVFLTLVVSAVSYNVYKRKCDKCISAKEVEQAISKCPTGVANLTEREPWVLNKGLRGSLVKPSRKSDADRLRPANCALCRVNQKLGHRIDNICKTVFPVSFFIASAFYGGYFSYLYYNHY